ncbi:MAG: CDP-diacylglycerol O-phosphatidyltransferase [Acidobacteriota bacterium]
MGSRHDSTPSTAAVASAWAVHLYTAFGAVLGLLALMAVIDGDDRAAFFWLIAATIVDSSDGMLARLARVKERTPRVDGTRLDDIVDYLTYVFVPAVLMLRAGLFPAGAGLAVAAAVLLASAFGFSRTDAKAEDHFFTGFPSYWNIVAFYLYAGGLSPLANAGIVLALAVLVFVPVGYLYPSRTPALRRTTIGLGGAWGLLVCWLVWRVPEVPRSWLAVSLAYPAYYVGVSLRLQARRNRNSTYNPKTRTPGTAG